MSREAEERNRRMLRARDAMERGFAEPLDIPARAWSRPSSFGEAPRRGRGLDADAC
ncbi:hypothetical protein [Nocardiopsis composta]|uniref:Uncharacterized protein n=1 Tax=Nocardiopsis composta TaxID=157465 RepID=A0A7W8QT87_9ACTN|nr:hypothetical protein [Nocardiopsis composta]MBB5436112.1 hypothetical protein [Nocardiopsis composta]